MSPGPRRYGVGRTCHTPAPTDTHIISVDTRTLAAKFRSDHDGARRYHPLACHLTDVAAVALALWDECLPAETKRALSAGLGLREGEARKWVAFLAGPHDLGKASRPFQAKYDRDHHALRLAGKGLEASTKADPGHGIVTAAQLPALLQGRGVSSRLANRQAIVLGGRHGVFPLLGASENSARESPEFSRQVDNSETVQGRQSVMPLLASSGSVRHAAAPFGMRPISSSGGRQWA